MELQLRRLLTEKKMTSKELANRLGTSKQYVANILSGRSAASTDMWQRVADAVGVKFWQLFAPLDEHIPYDVNNDKPDLVITDQQTGRLAEYVRVPEHAPTPTL